jgi:hypothetical protein
MKTRFVVLVAVVLSLSLAAGAGAGAKGFPGKTLAFQWTKNPDDYFVLTLKPNGTVKMNSTVQFYTISGAVFRPGSPNGDAVTGSGCLTGPRGFQNFHFHLTGTFNGLFMDMQGFIADTTANGSVYARNSGATWGTADLFYITLLTADQIKEIPYPGPPGP